MLQFTAPRRQEPTQLERHLNTSLIGMLVVSALLIGILIYCVATATPDNYAFCIDTATKYTTDFTVSYGDTSKSVLLPGKVDASTGETVTLTAVLHEDEITADSMLFYVQQCWSRVYVGDTLVWEKVQNPTFPIDLAPTSGWVFFRLPADFDGQTLRIELTTVFEDYAGLLPTIYNGTMASFIYMVLEQGAFSLIVGVPELVLGLILVLSSFFIRYRPLRARLMRFGIFAATVSFWALLESRISQLFCGDTSMITCLLFGSFFILPALACSFFLTFPSIDRCRYMHILYWLSLLCIVCVVLCQFFGIAYFIDMVPIGHTMIIILCIGLIKCSIDYYHQGDEREQGDAYIFNTIYLLMAFVIADVILYWLDPTSDSGKCTRIGLLLSTIYIGFSSLHEVRMREVERSSHELYRKLAFTDIMTGLSNRTAFEQGLAQLRESKTTLPVMLLMADMNGLKAINDNYGHAKGDEAIVRTGHLLLEALENTMIATDEDPELLERCSCYRIGGDEFCIIGVNVTEDWFIALDKEFQRLVREEDTATEYPYSIASGIQAVDESGIDECFKKADARMYEAKARSRVSRHC